MTVHLQDVLGLVLFGCEETVNPLEYQGVRSLPGHLTPVSQVKVVGQGLNTPDWEMVSYIQDHVRLTHSKLGL